MLLNIVERVRRSKQIQEVIVATSQLPADNEIEALCQQQSISYFRGDEADVLDRYYHAALQFKADVIVRITADCPLIEPALIDQMLKIYAEGQTCDYVSNTNPPRTFPRGLDAEIMSFSALQTAWREDKSPDWREHVTTCLLYTSRCV